jgi:glycosyltransferase involved in cell wall biosynthesis
MPSPIRVLHLISSLDVGGAETQLLRILSHTNRDHFDHSVLSLTSIGVIGEHIRQLGVSVRALKMARGIPSPQAVWEFWKILKASQAHILQSWMYHADLLGLLGRGAGTRKLVWNIRCSDVDMTHYRFLSKWVVNFLSYCSGIPDGVVVNSHAGKLVHERLGYHPRMWHIIPNGVDLDQIVPNLSARIWLRRECKVADDCLLIGLVARRDAMKDHRTFLKAAGIIHKKLPDVHFVLVGRGVDDTDDELKTLIVEQDLWAVTHLLGQREDALRITAGLDIACSSSAFGEGFSNAIGEAMASGVPCVVTDVGDSARIVGETGRAVPPKNPDALAQACLELIELGTAGRRGLGELARAKMEQQYDIRTITACYETLYTSLATSPSPQA